MALYLLLASVFYTLLAVTWGTRGGVNVFIKLVMIFMAITSIMLYLKQIGVVTVAGLKLI